MKAVRQQHASNGGREHNTSLEDRHQRVLEENLQLKLQRNELQEKVKDLTTKFRRLIRDLKMSPEAVEGLMSAKPSTSAGEMRGSSAADRSRPTTSTADSITVLTRERDELQNELKLARERIQLLERTAITNPSSLHVGNGTDPVLAQMQHNASVDQRTIESLREELRRAHQRHQELLHSRMQGHQATGGRSELQHTHNAQRDEQLRTVELQLQQLRLKNSELTQAVELLSRERDGYSLQLRLAKEAEGQNRALDAHTFPSSLDPMTLLELQQQIQEKSNNIAVISNRLQFSQSQVTNLKTEVERLLSELRSVHQQNADVKRHMFDLEHEKASLVLRCERLDQVESTLTLKDEELLRMEQQLLKNVERLNSVAKDVENAVRREMATRLSEADSSRDEADRLRRQREQQLYDTEAQLSDWKRKAELQIETVADLEKRLKKEQRERQEIAEKCASLTGMSSELGNDMHEAITLAAMRRRQNPNGGNDAQGLWDAMNWDEQWEAAKLREVLSTSTLDLELAEARLTQMQTQLDSGRELLQRISDERDTLMDDNRKMHQRLCGIQTCLAKSQIDRYRKAVVLGRGSANGVLVFALRQFSQHTSFSSGADAPALYFFTLDGFLGYDTMISRTVSITPGSTDNVLDISFAYENLTIDEVTVSNLRQTTFVIQLHGVVGGTTTIIAMAELSGASLLTVAENAGTGDGALFSETLSFISGEGQLMGTALADVVADNVFLPLLVTSEARQQALAFSKHGQVGFSQSDLKQLLFALRNVTGIQIAVYRIQGLPLPTSSSHHSPTLLSTTKPFYVYCTAAGTGGTQTIVDDRVLECSTVTMLPSSVSIQFDPATSQERVVHRITAVTPALIASLQEIHVSFVVFDRTNERVEDHVCMATIPLHPLLSMGALEVPVQGTVRMARVGELENTIALEYGFSWLTN